MTEVSVETCFVNLKVLSFLLNFKLLFIYFFVTPDIFFKMLDYFFVQFSHLRDAILINFFFLHLLRLNCLVSYANRLHIN